MKTQTTYVRPEVEILSLESAGGFLKGSITGVKIQPGKVEVKPYEDGFADDGGFKDISFD